MAGAFSFPAFEVGRGPASAPVQGPRRRTGGVPLGDGAQRLTGDQ